MLVYQAWINTETVGCVTLAPAKNGTPGWECWACEYKPAKGESVQTATWEFLGCMFDFHSSFKHLALNKIALWNVGEVATFNGMLERLEAAVKSFTHA